MSVRTVTVIIRLSEEHSVPFIVRCVRDEELALMPTITIHVGDRRVGRYILYIYIHKARPTASVTLPFWV